MPRRANAKAGESALQGHSDPLDKFTRHRRLNQPIARALYKDSDTIDVGRRIATCAETLGLDLYEHDEQSIEARLRAMRPCNARLCPFCEWRRTRAWRRRLFNGLEAFSETKEKRIPLFLTLTVPNPPLEDLRSTLKEMNKGWQRLISSKAFPTDIWFRRTEVTVTASVAHPAAFAHPHFHALLLVKPSYFGKGYIDHDTWRDRWSRSMRAEEKLIVDIRRVRAHKKPTLGSPSGCTTPTSENTAAVLEVAKYMAKGTQLLEIGESLPEFHRQMAGVRLYSVSKALGRYIKTGDINSAELMDDDEGLPDARLPDARAIAQWFEDSSEYLFTDIR